MAGLLSRTTSNQPSRCSSPLLLELDENSLREDRFLNSTPPPLTQAVTAIFQETLSEPSSPQSCNIPSPSRPLLPNGLTLQKSDIPQSPLAFSDWLQENPQPIEKPIKELSPLDALLKILGLENEDVLIFQSSLSEFSTQIDFIKELLPVLFHVLGINSLNELVQDQKKSFIRAIHIALQLFNRDKEVGCKPTKSRKVVSSDEPPSLQKIETTLVNALKLTRELKNCDTETAFLNLAPDLRDRIIDEAFEIAALLQSGTTTDEITHFSQRGIDFFNIRIFKARLQTLGLAPSDFDRSSVDLNEILTHLNEILAKKDIALRTLGIHMRGRLTLTNEQKVQVLESAFKILRLMQFGFSQIAILNPTVTLLGGSVDELYSAVCDLKKYNMIWSDIINFPPEIHKDIFSKNLDAIFQTLPEEVRAKMIAGTIQGQEKANLVLKAYREVAEKLAESEKVVSEQIDIPSPKTLVTPKELIELLKCDEAELNEVMETAKKTETESDINTKANQIEAQGQLEEPVAEQLNVLEAEPPQTGKQLETVITKRHDLLTKPSRKEMEQEVHEYFRGAQSEVIQYARTTLFGNRIVQTHRTVVNLKKYHITFNDLLELDPFISQKVFMRNVDLIVEQEPSGATLSQQDLTQKTRQNILGHCYFNLYLKSRLAENNLKIESSSLSGLKSSFSNDLEILFREFELILTLIQTLSRKSLPPATMTYPLYSLVKDGMTLETLSLLSNEALEILLKHYQDVKDLYPIVFNSLEPTRKQPSLGLLVIADFFFHKKEVILLPADESDLESSFLI